MFKFFLDTLRQSSASALLDFVSPSFFDVVPVGKSTVIMTNMMREALHTIPAEKKAVLQKVIDQYKIPVTLETSKAANISPGDSNGVSGMTTAEEGLAILKLYFALIFGSSESILDLRSQTFRVENQRITWRPAHVMHAWDLKGFMEPMREVYRGFYREDRAHFRSGLKELQLDSAEALFLAHFGEGDQSQVTFTMAGFRKSFHDIFVHCKAQKIRLHEDFLPLGILLGSLYENLSKHSAPLNVRQAFESVVG